MSQPLYFDGKKFISSKRAAELGHYTQDYIGQLIRGKKLDARMIGRAWYVCEDSLLAYQNHSISGEREKIFEEKKSISAEEKTSEGSEGIEGEEITADPPRVSPYMPLSYSSDERVLMPEIKKEIAEIKRAPLPEKIFQGGYGRYRLADISDKFAAVVLSAVLALGGYWMTDFKNIEVANSYLQRTGVRLSSAITETFYDLGNIAHGVMDDYTDALVWAGEESYEGFAAVYETVSHPIKTFEKASLAVSSFDVGQFTGRTIAAVASAKTPLNKGLESAATSFYRGVSGTFSKTKNYIAGLLGGGAKNRDLAYQGIELVPPQKPSGQNERVRIASQATTSTSTRLAVSPEEFSETRETNIIFSSESDPIASVSPIVVTASPSSYASLDTVSRAELSNMRQELLAIINGVSRGVTESRGSSRSVASSINLGNIRGSHIERSQITESTFSGTAVTTNNLTVTGSDGENTLTSSLGGMINFGSGTMFINSGNRNVGLGTTSPFTTFSVAGNSYFGGDITATGTISFANLVGSASTTLQNFTFVNATGTSATTTNLFSTTASSTNLFSSLLTVAGDGLLVDSNRRVGIGTTTPNWNLQVAGTRPFIAISDTGTGPSNSKHWLITSQGGNLYIATSSDALNATTTLLTLNSAGNLIVAGTTTLSGADAGITFTGSGTHDVTASSGTLRIGSNTIIGNIQALDDTVDIGTPGTRFDKIYANEVNASTVVGTLTGGNLIADTFNINSDNATADAENAYLSFERGSLSPNALLTWNSVLDRFEFNNTLYIEGAASTTLSLKGASGQTENLFNIASSTGSYLLNFTSGGNLGIGTTSPGQRLSVAGDILGNNIIGSYFTATTSTNSIFPNFTSSFSTTTNATTTSLFSTTASSTNLFSSLLTVAGNGLVVDSSRNVGIGTTTPQRSLTIANSGSNGQIMLTDTGAVADSHYGEIGFSRGGFAFNTMTDALATTSRMVINSSGNVGIGTTSPGQRLSVAGDILGNNIIGSYFTATSSSNTNTFGTTTMTRLSVTNTTASTDSTTGALVVSGGAGFGKDVWINSVRVGLGNNSVTTNTGVGVSVLNGSVSGTENSAFGNFALNAITSGGDNVGIGSYALYRSTTGSRNTGIGVSSAENRVGLLTDNTAVGYRSLFLGTTGSLNTAVGSQALYNAAGSGNVGIGYLAGFYETGSNSFYVNSIDRNNTEGDKTGSLIYGTFNATPASQTLTINASTSIAQNLNVHGTGNNYFAGNIGIGTTTPGQKLSVAGDILGNNIIGSYFTATTSTNSIFPNFTSSFSTTTNATTTSLFSTTASSTNLFSSLLTVAGNGLIVDSSRNVGIGTAAPITKVHIVGPALTTGTQSTYGAWISESGDETEALLLGYDKVTAGGIITAVDDGVTWKNIYINPNGGNVVIGGTTARALFDLKTGTALSGGDPPGIAVITGGHQTTEQGTLSLESNTAMAADKGGSLTFKGIWTGSTPAAFGAIGGYKENGTDGNYAGYLALYSRTNGAGTLAERMRIDSSGNIGIGTTTPQRILTVTNSGANGQLMLTDTGAVADSHYGEIGFSRGGFTFNTMTDALATTSRMVINSSGNLGIGTTTPAQLLSVQGNGLFSGNISAANLTATGTIALSDTTSSSAGVITIGGSRFLHSFTLSGTTGNNTFVGKDSGNFTMTGSTGAQGSLNSGFGVNTLNDLTTGEENSAFGVNALTANTTGYHNSAFGSGALLTNATGLTNSAFGYRALSVVTGSGNSGFGANVLGDLTSGGDNVALGANAGRGITTGNGNMILGGVQNLASGLTNTVVIGTGGGIERMRIDSSGNVGIGTTTPYSLLTLYKAGSTAANSPQLVLSASSTVSGLGNFLNNWAIGTDLADGGKFKIASSSVIGTNDRFVIDGSGNVGIGTTTPGAKLNVIGALCVDDTSPTCADSARTAGTIYSVAALSATLDLAESYPTKDATLAAGEIVELDPENPVFVRRATGGSGMPTVGIVSTAPGFWLGGFDEKLYAGEIKLPIALSGRVPIKVSNEGGDIEIGDRIALSSVAGIGMKQTGSGETVGIALEATESTIDIIEVFINLNKETVSNEFAIDTTGYVGIGTSTPEYRLHVIGDVAATSFVNISTREAKKDLKYLDENSKASILTKIKDIGIAEYRYNMEDGSAPLRLGLIAEEAPAEVLSANGKGVDVYKLSTFILAGVQELDKRFVALETKVADIEGKIAELEAKVASSSLSVSTVPPFSSDIQPSDVSPAATSSVSVTWSDNFASSTISFLAGLGAKIENGMARFVSIVADSITSRSIVVNSLTVGSTDNLAAAGVTTYDRETGELVCVYVANGSVRSQSGACGAVNTPSVSSPIPSDTSNTSNNSSNNPAVEETTNQETTTSNLETAVKTETTVEPATESPAETAAEPEGEVTTSEQPTTEPESAPAGTTAESASKPAAEPSPEPVPEAVSEPVSEPAPESAPEVSPEAAPVGIPTE